MKTILCILLGYLLGSLPFALIIGKVFYHTDIRQYGSGNLGGTNAGRVLGKKAGISVIVFDVLKVVLAIAIATQVSKVAGIWTGLASSHRTLLSYFRKIPWRQSRQYNVWLLIFYKHFLISRCKLLTCTIWHVYNYPILI